VGQLPLEKKFVVSAHQGLQCVVAGLCRLHDQAATKFRRAGPLGHLGEGLVGAFGGAEIGPAYQRIGVENSNHRDVGPQRRLRSYPGGEVDVGILETRGVTGQAL
jgi:hypothetical protein